MKEDPRPTCIVLDFRAVSGCDLSAVTCLCRFARSANSVGTQIVVCAVSKDVEESLRGNLPSNDRDRLALSSLWRSCVLRFRAALQLPAHFSVAAAHMITENRQYQRDEQTGHPFPAVITAAVLAYGFQMLLPHSAKDPAHPEDRSPGENPGRVVCVNGQAYSLHLRRAHVQQEVNGRAHLEIRPRLRRV